jgi:biotin synthase
MVDYQDFAAKALRDETLTRSECQAVLDTPDEQLLALLQAAFTVRSHYFGKTVRLQMLQNAKSGACQEDCHYCSQSAISTASIERYGLVPQQQMIDGARQAAASKAQRYCIVISGRSPLDREIDEIAGAVRAIKQEIPIQICCSLGLMNEQQAKRLKAAGVDRVNHNLNTSEAFHASICTTHTFQDRLSTIRNARAAGLEICSGGIVGMGEKDEDLIDLAMALRDVKPDSIPLNTLHPVAGTPLENCDQLTPQRCLFRFLHPRTEIRIAGGREHNLRSLQPLALYPADSVFVNGYLTTPGQPAPEVWGMIEDLGFKIEVDYQQAAEKGPQLRSQSLEPLNVQI